MDQIRIVIADIHAMRAGGLRDQRSQRDKISMVVLITEIAGVVFLAVTSIIVMRQTQAAMAARSRARCRDVGQPGKVRLSRVDES